MPVLMFLLSQHFCTVLAVVLGTWTHPNPMSLGVHMDVLVWHSREAGPSCGYAC